MTAMFIDWVLANTNTALRSRSDVTFANQALLDRGLPLHPDYNKNWDNFLALYHTNSVLRSSDEPVLDAGAGDESAYLPGLKTMGYTNLIGINLDRKDDYKAGVKDGIRYAYGDITSTPFPNGTFPFISCLSVIEHGVNVPLFLGEMARILKPGGHLFVSFDFWYDKLNTAGLITHDAPINIFSNWDVMDLLDRAAAVGLTVDPIVNTMCDEKIIAWAGLEYTFMNLLFRKQL